MANTEGLPDEFVESLARAGTGDAVLRRTSRPRVSSGNNPVRQSWLQQRMDLPMGESPAAKVIRASPRNNNTNHGNDKKDPVDGISKGQSTRTNKTSAHSPPSPPIDDPAVMAAATPLVGDVVEHQPQSFSKPNQQLLSSGKSKTSRFRLQKQNHPPTGFPSLNIPLGTFVATPKKDRPPTDNNSSQDGEDDDDDDLPALDPAPTCRSFSQSLGVTKDTLPTLAPTNINYDNDLIHASRKDAQAMITNMSTEEIQQAQQELQEAIPPELIAFLKSRGNKKKGQHQSTRAAVMDQSRNFQRKEASSTVTRIKKLHGSQEQLNEQKEKERIAKLVASVKTHEDLDAAYSAEMQQSHPLDPNDDDQHPRDMVNDYNENFRIACDLLRSTSPRQTMWAVRIVCIQLESMVKESTAKPMTTPTLPAILSVSLRCLLDKTVTSTYLLHTYALQSLYCLTLLYAHPAHVVYVSSDMPKTASNLYQQNFLDDAVPTPPLDTAYPPLSVQPLSINEANGQEANQQPAAYAAASSTTSALQDGKDFQRDPMWTLLSKMKIIPRLAYLLEHHQSLMPVEAWVAVCGILCMVGQRSPGAASVIVQHETLMPCLVKKTLEQIHGDVRVDVGERIPHAVLVLCCTLARQSRVAAQGLPLEELLPPILSWTTTSTDIFATQQLALTLWRIVLRYGLGLEALASMLTLSARHLALPYSNRFSLSTEFLSSYAQMLQCVKVFRAKSLNDTPEDSISQSSIEVLFSASKYMSSSIKIIIPQCSTPPDYLMNDEGANLTLRFRYNAARLMYLSCWFQLFNQEAGESDGMISIDDYLSAEDTESILLALEGWTNENGDMDRSWRLVIPTSSLSSIAVQPSLELEAAASGFINGFMALCASLSSNGGGLRPETQLRLKSLQTLVIQRILQSLRTYLQSTDSTFNRSEEGETLVRSGWINQCHFAIAKFLFHAISKGFTPSSSEFTLIRTMSFSLLARLHQGDEAIAAVLFSSDALFQTIGNPAEGDSPHQESSPISSLFLGELCGSDRSRKQLDHSFKLGHGLGLTPAGWGPFALGSLLSTLDQPQIPTDSQTITESPLLPLGGIWLWKTLSGSVRMLNSEIAVGTKEAIDVIAAVLRLLSEQEEMEDLLGIYGYCHENSIGSKMYYLMNLCLQSDDALSDDRVITSADALLEGYLKSFGNSEDDAMSFSKECFLHSEPTGKAKTVLQDYENDGEEVKGEGMLEKFVASEGTSLTAPRFPPEQLRALEAFIEDTTNSFKEYGAQFDFCTKCIRSLLNPGFPSSTRCRLLQELDGILHVLTLPKEQEDDDEISLPLERCISGGFSFIDGSPPDNADIINKVSSILARTHSRSLGKFMTAYCIAVLARNLGNSLRDSTLRQPAKSRMEKLDAKSVETICRATVLTRDEGGSKSSLIDGVLKAIAQIFSIRENDGTVVSAALVERCIKECHLWD
ncbi:RNA polymerase II-associated protein 1 (RPAP1) related protein [Nitzschia inconspicua]|uniref:RNA polymerase II-associated protein 1 (RPAP1) related protein n=1 Tax=Nitzschia inconspicua TaxID=303405 RepID=A0A9K3PX00_9STRA|nr:RNA polymerase II-associated protein 1 (RPAP1) related protein [Nitzschia inconspicua]